MHKLTRAEEAKRLMQMYGPDAAGRIMESLERQFTVLHNRAQVLLGLCGIVVTTTGFSGRLIAGTNATAQWLVIGGVTLSLLAGALVVWGVLHLRWLSQQAGELTEPWLITCLEYRDLKTSFYRAAISVLLIGLALYVAAVSIMLLNPHADAASVVR
jgi:hypothetical protein